MGIVTRVQAGWSGVQILVGLQDFSFIKYVQTDSAADLHSN